MTAAITYRIEIALWIEFMMTIGDMSDVVYNAVSGGNTPADPGGSAPGNGSTPGTSGSGGGSTIGSDGGDDWGSDNDVPIKDLRRLPDDVIKEMGGETWAQKIKRQTGKSAADLYWNPKTGKIYTVIKRKGLSYPQLVAETEPRR
jgi:hypothetical protein